MTDFTPKPLKANSDGKKLSREKPYAYLGVKLHFDVLQRPCLQF